MSATTRLDDNTAHDRAIRHAIDELGLERAPRVCWDTEHQLQGHLDIDGRHLVLIATRRDDRRPLLLTDGAWDRLHRAACRGMNCA